MTEWVLREHLEMGFTDKEIRAESVRPLISGLDPYEAKWLEDEDESVQALEYMIGFLRTRSDALNDAEDVD